MRAIILTRSFRLIAASSRLRMTTNLLKFYSSKKKNQDSIEDNPFYSKYQEKLAALQDTRYNTETEEISDATPSLVSQQKYPSSSVRSGSKMSLDSILNIEDLLEKTPEEIARIWDSYHSHLDCIHGTIPTESYTLISTQGSLCPYFVYPIPSDKEYSFFFQEFSNDEFHFTNVQEYNLLKEHAPVYLTVAYYSEFAKEKGIALMVGKYDLEKLKTEEAQLLAQLLQLYYGQNRNDRVELVRKFNMNPNLFNYQELIDQIDALSLY